jgi:hypothetical protein
VGLSNIAEDPLTWFIKGIKVGSKLQACPKLEFSFIICTCVFLSFLKNPNQNLFLESEPFGIPTRLT